MIPHIRFLERVIAWLIWHYEGYESVEDARFCIIEHPKATRVASLMRDYWYVRHAREMEVEVS